jgi:hypoxanthine phosphoribosyltransferase
MLKPLLSEDEIREGVRRLAGEIGPRYAGEALTVVGVLTGSLVLVADLIRQLDLPLRLGLVQAKSYRGAATRPGELSVDLAHLPDVRGRHVLLVDDIYDTGRTLAALLDALEGAGAASVRSAVLLRKRGRQEAARFPDHVAFEIPDVFVVGYGLDYQDQYRHLPYVAALDGGDPAGGPA